MTINEMQKELMQTYNREDLMSLITEVVFDITEFIQNTRYRNEQEDSRDVRREVVNWAWEFEYLYTYVYNENDDDYLLRLEGFVEKKLKKYEAPAQTYKVYFTDRREGWVLVEATCEEDAMQFARDNVSQVTWGERKIKAETYQIIQ